ncbi:MAG: cytosine permease [Candidatus Thermoplasmatota archaeon]|nr:cytosine permease [Candidatus Thermoplasmatota archaeon]
MSDKVDIDNGQVYLDKESKVNDYLWNPDFNPVPKDLRKWGASSFTSLWVAMAVIVPTWTLATVGLALGLNWTQVIAYMFLGNLIILIPTIIQSHGGARYGVAEPQLTRSRWGIYGAQIPSWIRSVISMGWWGIESFIIAEAATYIYLVTAKASVLSTLINKVGPGTLPRYFPTVFWTIFTLVIIAQLLIFYISPPVNGQKPLRIMAKIAAPIMIVSFVVMFYIFMSAGKFDFTPITTYNVKGAPLLIQFVFINANVAYWATMAVSMPDYTKYAKSQYSQTIGQIPMPFIMMAVGAMALLGAGASISAGWLHVSSAAGFFSYDPLELIALYFPNYYAIPLLIAVIIGTFSVNVFANSIAPGYDIANTYPKKLTWFRGILIGVVISILLGAYTAYSTTVYAYVYSWLLAYGALLGMVEGIIVFDYAIMRHFKLNIKGLFEMKGVYTFFHGFNPAPIISGLIAIVITYIYEWGISKAYIFQLLYDNSWISAFFIAGLLDLLLNVIWIIPKYGKLQNGNLRDGYVDPETSALFDPSSSGAESTGEK